MEQSAKLKSESRVQVQPFGTLPSGEQASLFVLSHSTGIEAKITNFGATLVSLKVLDRSGNASDIVLGLDFLEEYVQGHPYMGSIVGRYANRIAQGQFTLEGQTFQLAKNNGQNHLHGGTRGFSAVLWEVEEPEEARTECETEFQDAVLKFTYLSPHGEEGYPGALSVSVIYRLSANGELRIDYSGKTDRPTILNMTHHSYFNLAGQGEGDVLDHQLRINADEFLPIDPSLIPTGQKQSVSGTPLDFREACRIGQRIQSDFDQLKIANGYDHCFVLNGPVGKLRSVAQVTESSSGRVMEVLTTEPGMQLYTGNFLDIKKGKAGKQYQKHFGFCLETQHFPDSPNQPEFPSTVLRPGQKYQSTTIYRFSTTL